MTTLPTLRRIQDRCLLDPKSLVFFLSSSFEESCTEKCLRLFDLFYGTKAKLPIHTRDRADIHPGTASKQLPPDTHGVDLIRLMRALCF